MVCVLIVEIVEMGCGLEMMGARRGSVDQPDPRVSAQTPPLHSIPGKTKLALTCSRLKTFPAADRNGSGEWVATMFSQEGQSVEKRERHDIARYKRKTHARPAPSRKEEGRRSVKML